MTQLRNTFAEWFLLIQNICHKKICFNWLPLKICYNEKGLLFQLVAMSNYWKQPLRGVLWNQLKSENIDIFYLLSALKEPLQIDCNKTCSVMEQAWISTFCRQTYLLKISLTHFLALVFFYNSWNTSENRRFPNVSRGH